MLTSSVAMCTYNGARYIREQLGSILGGTCLPDEIVIHDDQSTDEVADIVAEVKSNTRIPIVFTVNEHRLGSTRNFDGCIAACRHDIIFLSDQDDVWKPDKLERLMTAFGNHPDVGAIFTNAAIVDEQLRDLNSTMFAELGFFPGEGDGLHHAGLLDVTRRPVVTGATLAFRRALNELILPTPPSRYFIHDQWIAAVAASAMKLCYFSEPLVLYRQHEQQQLGRPKAETVPAKTERQATFKTMTEIYRDYVAPLCERLPTALSNEAVDDLRGALAHSEVRLALPSNKLARVQPILREFAGGGYTRYSRGVRSAIKDLVG